MRVLALWRWSAVLTALALSACSGGPIEGGDAGTSSSVVQKPERLRGAFASAAPGGLWVVGGAVLSDTAYQAMTEMSAVPDPDLVAEAQAGSNDLLVRYQSDAALLEAVRLPLGSRSFLHAEVVTADAGVVVTGITCPGPLGCGPSEIRPFAAVVADGEARELDLGIDWPSPTVSIAGVANGEVVVVAADEETGVVVTGGHVQALAIDPATAAMRPLSLPDGVRFARSVCARDDRLVAVTPVLIEHLDLAGIEVWAGGGQPGSPLQRVGRLDLPPAYAGGDATGCTAGAVAVAVVTDRARVLVFDTASGLLVADIATGVGSVELLADRDQVLLVGQDLIGHDEEASGLRLQGWTSQSGVSDLSDTPDSDRRVLLVDGRAVDVTDLLEHVPGSDGPALTSLS
jgi:hypothetical protein